MLMKENPERKKKFNKTNELNSKLDVKPAQSQQKRYYNNTFDIFLLFLGDFGQDFLCLAK